MKKEYEMPDEYKRNLALLVEMIEERDEYVRIMPTLPPGVRAQAKSALDELNCAVEGAERRLAAEYERFQNEQRSREELRETFGRLQATVERIYIVNKHTKPHLIEDFEAVVFQDMPNEEIEEFYDRIAIREAAELDEILKAEAEAVARQANS